MLLTAAFDPRADGAVANFMPVECRLDRLEVVRVPEFVLGGWDISVGGWDRSSLLGFRSSGR